MQPLMKRSAQLKHATAKVIFRFQKSVFRDVRTDNKIDLRSLVKNKFQWWICCEDT